MQSVARSPATGRRHPTPPLAPPGATTAVASSAAFEYAPVEINRGAGCGPSHRHAVVTGVGRDYHHYRSNIMPRMLELHMRIHVLLCHIAHDPFRVVRVRRHAVDLRVAEQAVHCILVPSLDWMSVPIPVKHCARHTLQRKVHFRESRMMCFTTLQKLRIPKCVLASLW